MGASNSKHHHRYGITKTAVPISKDETPSSSPPCFFHILSDDLVILILSYISYAPFEHDTTNPRSTLTHILPLVCKRFRDICNNDSLWLTSFQRLIHKNPNQWKYPLSILLDAGRKSPPWSALYNSNVDKDYFMLAAKISKMDTLMYDEFMQLITNVYNAIQVKLKDDDNNIIMKERNPLNNDNNEIDNYEREAKSFYLNFIINYSRLSVPILDMPYGNLVEGMSINLTLFETQYDCFISYILSGKDYSSKTFLKMKEPRPKFIFANESLRKGSTARFAEVIHCKKLHGGRFQLGVTILKMVQLLDINERNEMERYAQQQLYDAQIKRF